jgi:CRISPR-associated exonuclease Cas4
MKLKGIEAEKGVIEYPSLRQKEEVILTEDDILYLENTVLEIKKLKEDETCPPVINAKICKSCSYYEFCYVNE